MHINMSAAQEGKGGLEGTIVVTIVTPASIWPLLVEEHNFKQNFLGPLKIIGDIVSNLALNGYSTLA